MKILQVHNYYLSSGGEDAVLLAEQKMLISYGNEVIQYTIDNSEIVGLIGKIKTSINLVYSRETRASLKAFIQLHKPDIVHVHNFFPLLTPSIYDACIETGVSVVQTLHNYRTMCPGGILMRDGHICEDCIEGTVNQSIIHHCYKDSYIGSFFVARMVEIHRNRKTWNTKVDRFIALTEFAKLKFIQAGFPADKILVKSNFIDADVNSRECIHSDKSFALFVGRLSKEKGIETMLKAWEHLICPLCIVGDGVLLKMAQSTESKFISCLGQMSAKDVAIKMNEASFLVMPSEWYEGFPMVLVEAFAHGLPVVASRLGGMAEIIEDGVTGLHFEAGNYQDLTEKVQWMHDHPDDCKKMGLNARKIYDEKYTAEKNYKILMKIYSEAINNHA